MLFKTTNLSIYQLIDENENNMRTIKDLRRQSQSTQSELDRVKELNADVTEAKRLAESQLEILSVQFNRNVSSQDAKRESNDEQINNLEIELAKSKSKIDEAQLQLAEFKTNFTSQTKLVEHTERRLREKETECDELKLSYENCVLQFQNLNHANATQKQEYEMCIRELEFKVDEECNASNRSRTKMDSFLQRAADTHGKQQKKIESLVALYKGQTLTIQNLRDLIEKFKEQFCYLKPRLDEYQSQFNENNSFSKFFKI